MTRTRRKGEVLPFPPAPQDLPPSPFVEAVEQACSGVSEPWQFTLRSLAEEVRCLKNAESQELKLLRRTRIQVFCEYLRMFPADRPTEEKKQISDLLEFLRTSTRDSITAHILRSTRLAVY